MVTIVLPVSRDTFLQRIFANLDSLVCISAETNLLVYVDGDLNLYEKARNLTVNSKFAQKLCIYRRKGMPNVGSVRSRRVRIADIHSEFKALIDKCDYIFLLEDDTLMPTTTLAVLLKHYSTHPFAGFISAIEIGRWGFTHIGAWKVDDIYNPKQITSVPNGEGLVEVDAAGFYCCLVKYENYMRHDFKPFEDILGPDVNFGIELRKIGLKNYIDYSLHCKHLTIKDEITFLNTDIVQVQFDKEGEKWSMKQL